MFHRSSQKGATRWESSLFTASDRKNGFSLKEDGLAAPEPSLAYAKAGLTHFAH